MHIGTFLCLFEKDDLLLEYSDSTNANSSPMLNIILFDSDARDELLPLTATRPMGELRLGILTLREKWERFFKGSVSYITQEYLQEKYPINIEEENFIVNAGVLPNNKLC